MEKIKIPKRISIESMPVFFFAGLYVKIGDGIFASIITTSPNSAIAKIHNRMPVIFNQEEGINYLKADEETAITMCLPFDDTVPVNMETAEDILTIKQKEFLKGK